MSFEQKNIMLQDIVLHEIDKNNNFINIHAPFRCTIAKQKIIFYLN